MRRLLLLAISAVSESTETRFPAGPAAAQSAPEGPPPPRPVALAAGKVSGSDYEKKYAPGIDTGTSPPEPSNGMKSGTGGGEELRWHSPVVNHLND